MSKIKKKYTHKPANPPLSPLNKFLYFAFLIFGMALLLAIFIFFMMWQQNVGKANGAVAVNSTSSAWLIFIPIFSALLAGIVLFAFGYDKCIPIVGRTKTEKRISPAKITVISLAVALWLLSFVPVIGAVYSREELTETHIKTYGMFGKFEESRPIEDAAAVHAKIYSIRTPRSSTVRREMSYTVYFEDGKSFLFQNHPLTMIKIDDIFRGKPKTVGGTEHFEKLCEEYNCTPEERERLRELFLIDD